MPTVQVIMAAVLMGLVPAPAPTAEPQLNIAVDDARTSAAEGDEPAYTIKVRNIGPTEADELQISQSLPAGLSLISVDHDGAAVGGQVTWTVNLKPGEEITLATVGRVGSTPSQLLRLAVVACATAKDGSKPLVCATDSDLLPAGAAATAPPPSSGSPWPVLAAVVVLAGVGGAMFLLWRARRRPRPPASPPPTGARAKASALTRDEA